MVKASKLPCDSHALQWLCAFVIATTNCPSYSLTYPAARMPLQMIMAAQFGLIALPLAHWRRPSIRIVFSRAFCLREHIIIIIVWRWLIAEPLTNSGVSMGNCKLLQFYDRFKDIGRNLKIGQPASQITKFHLALHSFQQRDEQQRQQQ